jgi:probable rRNA maturation factor
MPTKNTPTPRRRNDAGQRIRVQRVTRARGMPGAGRLRAWARAACPPVAEVTLRVVGMREAERLNAAHRRRDVATNVLSFCYERGRAVRGDIVLCHPIVLRESHAQGKTPAAHYAHLVVHGVLHLRGFDHTQRADAARMEAMERRILRRLGIADPYVLPADGPHAAR